ncbi:hypothetical protein C8A05DRAFT_47156 [Staphylotrichum tortipilum]|uniref:Uncharacterized protein n=1 Tax=Staphylotrichum tortipilum TaxID=2831512 RepID=A0AAN6RQ07_9PEZI|nr:hypothetical protein C8A05DRAFT_47156 [Staphylotrichum longicolle]
MASPDDSPPPEPPAFPPTLSTKLTAWGTSALPPMTLTTLIIALHARPPQPLPLVIPPLLIFSSYLTLAGFQIDGAGMTAAWSGIYTLLALRRRPASLRSRFSLRGFVRGTAVGLGAANTVAGLYVYGTGDRVREEKERREGNRWGVYKD